VSDRTILHVVIAAPGKGVGKGGVVRQMQYLVQEATKYPDKIRYSWLSTHSGNRFWPLYFIGTILRFIVLALTDKPVAIHLNVASKGSFWRKYILYRIARAFGIKHIAHLHGGGFADFYAQGGAFRKTCIESLFRDAAAVIVLGKIWKEFVLTLGVEESHIHLLANAVPTPPQVSKGGGDVPHIIFTGHLLPRKGVGELIDALAGLKELNWRATLAGSGEKQRYQQQVEKQGLSDRVTFPGWLDDDGLNALYQQADILVLPSHIENQPLSVLEAMAHGLAIICTNVGTVNEIVDETTAIVINNSQSAEALKNALKTLLESPQKRREIATLARKRHEESFSLSLYLNYYIGITFKL